MKTIGDRIKILRKDVLKKSQKEFGEKIGLKPNSVSCIETGINSITEQTIKAICREFNINEDWLRDGKEPMGKNIDLDFGTICADIGVSDPKAKEAIIKYYELSDDDKELWWNFMERFVK